ncbi:C-terminal binding protein [Haloglomus litoreum]|uniref:C-terminal binding protein n=1 Tax=Haloglomus litoreum TaxID=3034026 RepID=UPI0023E8BBC5|nr:C-terminal binding protein [Haloglomus sp. DT116]
MSQTVVYTDHTFDDLDVERAVFDGLDVTLVDGEAVSDVRSKFPDADALAVMFDDLTREDVARLDDCAVVTRVGTGVDNFDIAALTERGIPLANVPDYCTPEVSDHALALLFALSRNVVAYDRSVRTGEWDVEVGHPMRRIADRTLGVVSFGKTGRAVARRAAAVGFDVLVYGPHTDPGEIRSAGHDPVEDLSALLGRVDAVSIHAPLTPETEGLFDREAFAAMRDSALLVNTARGGIVDHDALVAALETGEIAAAGLDVLPEEPPPADHPLFDLENVVCTPHVAWHSVESERELRRKAAENIRVALEGGEPASVVNPEALD